MRATGRRHGALPNAKHSACYHGTKQARQGSALECQDCGRRATAPAAKSCYGPKTKSKTCAFEKYIEGLNF